MSNRLAAHSRISFQDFSGGAAAGTGPATVADSSSVRSSRARSPFSSTPVTARARRRSTSALSRGQLAKPYLARDGELRGRQADGARDLPQPAQRASVTGEGSAVQLAGLAAELIQIGAGGKLGHGTSPHAAGPAFRLG